MFPGLPPARRRLRAVRHQLRRRRRLIAAALTAVAALGALRTLAPPPAETVEVLVAARDLPSGSLLADDDLVTREWPADLVPGRAASAPAGRVLAAAIGRGEVVTDVRLAGARVGGEAALVARDVTVLATPTGVPDGPAGGSGGALVVVGASAEEAVTIAGASLTQFLTVSWNR